MSAHAAETRIDAAVFPRDRDVVRALFREYAEQLGVDLCFQGFEAELAELPGRYAPPGGTLLLARDASGCTLGCVALRALGREGLCEMKRLYVVPAARGQQLGRRLAEEVLAAARRLGHRRIVLDTLASMQAARGLYAALGFTQIEAYYENPLPGTVYLGRDV